MPFSYVGGLGILLWWICVLNLQPGHRQLSFPCLQHLKYMVVNGTYRYADLHAGQELPSIMPNQAVFFVRWCLAIMYMVGS